MRRWQDIRVAVASSFNAPGSGMRYQAEVLADLFESEGAKVHRISFQQNRYLRPFSTFVELLAAARRLDVVCVQAFSFGNFLNAASAIAAGRLSGRRVVAVYRGGAAPEFLGRNAWARWLLRRTHLLITPSAYLQEAFRELGLNAAVIPNLIDLDEYPFKERDRFAPRLVWVRHLRRGYNPYMAIEALRLVQEEHPEATLALIGGGYMLDELRAHVERERIPGVEITGDLPQAELREWLARSDIFISTTNYDNLPRSLLEAMSCGLPVISTDVGGIPFLIDHGENGLMVPAEDARALADAVLSIVHDPARGRALVAEARRRLVRYTWQDAGPRWLAALSGEPPPVTIS